LHFAVAERGCGDAIRHVPVVWCAHVLVAACADEAAAAGASRALATARPASPVRITGTGYAAQSATCSQAYLPLPDPSCTPGAYNADVTQSTIDSTI
jgi:hypothetical protein